MNSCENNTCICSFISLLIVAALAGCDNQGYYKENEPELHSVAINSLLGVPGKEEDDIIILDEDDYGRKMFAFIGPTIYNRYTSEEESEHNNIAALLISQSTVEGCSWYYDSINYIIAELHTDKWPSEYDSEEVLLSFSDDQIMKLKNDNDWGKPVDLEKCFVVKTIMQKRNTVLSQKL